MANACLGCGHALHIGFPCGVCGCVNPLGPPAKPANPVQPTFNHIMLDLETLGTGPDAAILSIGAVKFCLETYTLGKEFYRVINLASCIDANLSIDASTIEWWMQQGEEARAVFNLPLDDFRRAPVERDTKVPLISALSDFRTWALGLPPGNRGEQPFVWGNGSMFDNAILRNAYKECKMKYPVSYRYDMDYRTICTQFALPDTKVGYAGVKHNALDDARFQATELMRIMKAVRR